MGLLTKLFRGVPSFSISIKRSDTEGEAVTIEGDSLVMRVKAPDIDPSSITFESHGAFVHIKGTGKTAAGDDMKFHEIVSASGGDESRAVVTKEADEVVIRMPRD